MKLFLSWSGDVSHQVAKALYDWLPYVLQAIKPTMSSQDINKGERWNEKLAEDLQDAQYGIICLTHYNLNKPWINFEAGSLSKFVDQSYVYPFLFHVDKCAISGPLLQFQSTIYEKEEVLTLVCSINQTLPPQEQVEPEILRETFETWWPKLEKALADITDSERGEPDYPWLYTLEQLVRSATTYAPQSIWVITHDLNQYAPDSKKRRMVEEILKSSRELRFLIPHSDMTEAIEQNLCSVSPGLQQVSIKKIPWEEFSSQAVTDYVILKPTPNDMQPPQVFFEVPLSIEPRDYWIKVDSGAALGFAERFRKMWEREEVIKPASIPSQ